MKTKRRHLNKNVKRSSGKKGEGRKKDSAAPVLEVPDSGLPEIPSFSGEPRRDIPAPEPSDPPETVSSPVPPDAPAAAPEGLSTPSVSAPEESVSEEGEVFGRGEDLELLTFSLAKEEYAIDIMMIQEITKVTDITPIPRAPSYIHGIVTLRGNVIPVFNMHDRLRLDPFEEKGKSRFVICQLKEGPVAITVDEVIEVVHLKKSHLEPPPSGIAVDGEGFIKNIGKFKDRLLILLDVEKGLQIDLSLASDSR